MPESDSALASKSMCRLSSSEADEARLNFRGSFAKDRFNPFLLRHTCSSTLFHLFVDLFLYSERGK